MIRHVLRTILRYRMLEPGQRVGVAVSGGADSVCLLGVLSEIARDSQHRLEVLHLNHGLRGEAAREDAQFVRELAAGLGLPVHVREVDARSLDPNVEQGGREARLALFREFLASGSVDRIATGHTLDDQAETVLYRLLRGSGSLGLCGILPATAEGVVRPLIETTRAEVESYLREHGLKWREDATNLDRSFARNRIRHDLLPALAQDYNRAIREALARTARLSLEDEQYFADQVDGLAKTILVQEGKAIVMECRKLADLPQALARRLLRHAIQRVRGDLRSIDFEHVEQSLALASSREGSGRLQIPGVDVFRSFDWLRLAQPATRSADTRNWRLSLDPPARVRIPGELSEIVAEFLEDPDEISTGLNTEAGYNERVSDLDLENASGRLEVRNWRPGDEYRRMGRDAPEKIKFLFQEARVPLWKRRNWPIITSGEAVVWVKQFGPAAEFAANATTRRILRVSITDSGS